MYNRYNEVPVFECRPGIIQAATFNKARLALSRFGNELRLTIADLKTLDLIIQLDAWIIVDWALNDVPVAAWTEFNSKHRSTLHHPIQCRIRLFHANAGIVLKQTLDTMGAVLDNKIRQSQSHQVLPFSTRGC